MKLLLSAQYITNLIFIALILIFIERAKNTALLTLYLFMTKIYVNKSLNKDIFLVKHIFIVGSTWVKKFTYNCSLKQSEKLFNKVSNFFKKNITILFNVKNINKVNNLKILLLRNNF